MISYHNEVIVIPIFNIFNENQKHKFYVFKFSDKYDGIIGTNLLEQIKAIIDMNRKLLITPRIKIPIIYECDDSTYNITINPRSKQIVKIPVNIEKGTVLLNYTNFGKSVETPEAIVNVENYFALTTVTNSNIVPIEITFNEPMECEILNIQEINCLEKMEIDEPLSNNQDNILKSNLKQLRLEHCNQEEKKAIRELCFEYRDIFYCEKIPLTFTNQIQHKINLKNETPIYTKTYRYPEVHKEEVRNQINKMMDQGIIQDSISPWSSPIWIVPKKLDASGKRKWRLVVDYRKLNEETIDDKYPLPNISDILDKLGRSQYFTTLDLANGFHQIEMCSEDICKTAFSTENGHYEFKRMPFGLKNAPSTFQRVMDNVLRGIQNEECLVYLDDIVIFSTSLQEHLERLRKVFERLRKANFKVQLDKSEFLRKEVNYLGHVITSQGVKPNPDKIEAIKKFPIPTTPKEIKSFLGLVGYYRKFIQNFAKITKPLTKCLKKNSKIIHNQEFISAFNTCKNLLINAPILQYPDFKKPFILTTDASNVALGAVLSQGQIGSDKPIAFASRTLNETETRYSTIEKELLAIVWACKYFRPYLFGRKFTIYTDHRPLIWLFNLKEPNSKLVRWRLKLEEFDYDIMYKKGKINTNADALSRIQINALENESMINHPGDTEEQGFDPIDYLRDLAENVDREEQPSTSQKNTDKTKEKEKIKILQDIQIRSPRTRKEVQKKELQQEEEQKQKHEDIQEKEQEDLTTQHSNVMETTNDGISILEEIINNKTNQILVFPHLHNKLIVNQENYQHHKIINVKIPKTNNYNLIFEFLRDYTVESKTYHMYFHLDEFYKQFNKVYLERFSEKGPKLIRCTKLINTVIDKEEQILLIKNHHEGKTNHRGISETLEYLKRNYFWIGMKKEITNYINCCDICQRAKYCRKKPYSPLMLTETASKPFQNVHIDVFYYNSKMYLTLVDAFSKYAQAIEIPGKNAINIANALIKYIAFAGIPEKIILDNGAEFKNETVKELLNLHKIKVHFTTPLHHESNSVVERFHSTIIEHLRLLKESFPTETEGLMDYAIIAYNNTIHSSTKYTPFELTFGHTNSREPNEIFNLKEYFTDYTQNHKQKLEKVYEKVKEDLNKQKEKVVSKHNVKGNTNDEFKLGQTVYKLNPLKRNKSKNKFLGPYTITKMLERNRVEITRKKDPNKKEILHIQELRKPPVVSDSPPPMENQNTTE